MEVNAARTEEACCECGRSVAAGSGLFVNRVANFDDYETNLGRGCSFPEGEYVCAECHNEIEKLLE